MRASATPAFVRSESAAPRFVGAVVPKRCDVLLLEDFLAAREAFPPEGLSHYRFWNLFFNSFSVSSGKMEREGLWSGTVDSSWPLPTRRGGFVRPRPTDSG